MNITDFLKKTKPAQLKEAKKLAVRDLDEINKNSFVAYVDQANESYDTQIILDDNKNILSKKCDCNNTDDCLHEIAMINFLANEKKLTPKTTKGKQRKITETDRILNEIDPKTLKKWVSNLLNNNKEVAFLFKNEFGKKNTSFEKKDIQEIIKLAIQSVIGKRKSIETNEVKKVIDNLNISLKEVLQYIFSSEINDKTYNLLETIIDELLKFEMNYNITSIRITRFIESLNNTLLKTIFNTKDLETWKQSVEFYFSKAFDHEIYSSYDFELIKNIYSFSEINELQRTYVIKLVERKFTEIQHVVKDDFTRLHVDFEMFFLNIFSENKLFEKHKNLFKPRRFQNEYNMILIQNLIEINELEKAENYCNEQINNNTNHNYDLPYINFLAEIYSKTNNTSKKATLLANYGVYSFDFENYLFLKKNCSPVEFKKYRQKILTNANYSSQNGDIQAFDFYYKVMKDDGLTNKLISLLAKTHNLTLFDLYKEEAFAINPIDFIAEACAAATFSTQNKHINEIANFIYNNTNKKLLNIYLTDRRIHEFSKLYRQIKELDSN
ncbi:hypothetical protein [Flavobacterium daejeonense]|uniref:hypothetical protein n=1 Tax=Flavobacterium daejeonense TaxID=350893 RepID=UPI000479ADDC|nr:hypothetical protein [Flavobacterium daejeonense]